MSSKSTCEEQQLVVFFLGDTEFGIHISVVREIISEIDIVKVPGMPNHFEGVINLRGSVIPVVDLATRLAVVASAKDVGKRNIMVVEAGDSLIGCLVTGVSEVLNINKSNLEDILLKSGSNDNRLIHKVCNLEDRMFPVIGSDFLLGEAKDRPSQELLNDFLTRPGLG